MISLSTWEAIHHPLIFEQARRVLRAHGPALSVVTVCMLLGQYEVHTQLSQIVIAVDTHTYVNAARRLLSRGQFFDLTRTPGYPLFLALFLAIFGSSFLVVAAGAQTLLMIAAIYEIYYLMFRVSHQVWAAALCASMLAINLYLLDWERVMYSETLAFWCVVTTFVVFEQQTRTKGTISLVALVILLFADVMVRPIAIYLPALCFALLIVQSIRQRELRRRWWRICLAFSVTALLLFGYMVGYARTNGPFGFTDVTSINLVGKVLEYHMENEYTNPTYAQVASDAQAYIATVQQKQGAQTSVIDPYYFVLAYPRYNAYAYIFVGRYARDVTTHHPVEYTRHSLQALGSVDTATPFLYSNVSSMHALNYQETLGSLLRSIGLYIEGLTSFTLFLALLIGVVLLLRSYKPEAITLGAIVLAELGGSLVVAFGSYSEYYRLRFPTEWGVVFGFILVGTEGIVALTRRSTVLLDPSPSS